MVLLEYTFILKVYLRTYKIDYCLPGPDIFTVKYLNLLGLDFSLCLQIFVCMIFWYAFNAERYTLILVQLNIYFLFHHQHLKSKEHDLSDNKYMFHHQSWDSIIVLCFRECLHIGHGLSRLKSTLKTFYDKLTGILSFSDIRAMDHVLPFVPMIFTSKCNVGQKTREFSVEL